MRKTGLPVVYLANDYSKDEEPELNVSAFEEWDYNDYNKKNKTMEKNQMMDMHVEKGLDSENVIDSSSLDPLFEEAARIIVTMRSGFASLIQRRLSIGYNRAVRIMDQLEKAGIVGVAQGSKPREVKMQDENSLENLLVALRRTTEIINNMTNEEAYKDIKKHVE